MYGLLFGLRVELRPEIVYVCEECISNVPSTLFFLSLLSCVRNFANVLSSKLRIER